MPWFRVDDDMSFHHKIVAAGNAAVGLWTRAGAWSSRYLTDGFIPDLMVDSLGTKAQATKLVTVGLWTRVEGGFRFHQWSERQPFTKDSVEADREAARERMRRIRKGRSDDVRANTGRSSDDVRDAQSRPVPTLSVVTYPSQSPTALDALTDEDWQKIQDATRGDRSHAHKVAADVLLKAAGEVTSPRRYILRAVKNEPELYRYVRGNPKRHQECPTHAGQWADACSGCAADRKAGA